MDKFLSQVRDFDNFGKPISVNYKGDSQYRTLPGAILTLILKVLIFTFTILSILEMITYKNPNISQVSLSDIISPRYEVDYLTASILQYSIYDSRVDSPEINLAGAGGLFVIGFYDSTDGSTVELDPRIGRFQFTYGHFNPFLFSMEPIRELELEYVDRERHSEFFTEGSILSGLDDSDSRKVYTLANPELVNLKDTIERYQTNKMIQLKILRCEQDTLPEGQKCAEMDEFESFFKAKDFFIIALVNYIDFDKVGHDGESPIETTTKTTFFEKLDLSVQPLIRNNFLEHRVTMIDSLFQLIATPETFSYLNMVQESINVVSERHDPENSIITFVFDLALQVKIENRKVNSISELFGHIYGIKDFLVFIFSLVLGSLPANRYLQDQVNSLFLQEQKKRGTSENTSPSYSRIWLDETCYTHLRLAFCRSLPFCCASQKDRRLYRLHRRGDELLSQALDTRTIIGYQRIVTSLASHLLPKLTSSFLKTKHVKQLILDPDAENTASSILEDFSLNRVLQDQFQAQVSLN